MITIDPCLCLRYAASLSLLAMVSLTTQNTGATPDVAEQRECATCHIMWLNDFKREDISTLIPYDPKPIVDTGQQDASSTSLMCLSCHDGFVLDSRALWKDGHQGHPVGMEPSDAIARPLINDKNLFPLNDDGKVYCGTCHTAHGVDWSSQDTPIFMRVPSRDGQLCQGCHVDRTEGPATGNHPVNVLAGQATGSQHLSLSSDGKVTCQSCHTAHEAEDDKILVVANDNSQLCRACHIDQDAATLQIAASAGTHPVNTLPVRAQVAEELFSHGGRMGDKGQLICQSCHMPHRAQSEQGILIVQNQDSNLCQACHQKEKQVVGSRHDVETGGACGACHVAHGGNGPKMWAREIPPGTDLMSGLCLSCHTAGGIAEGHQTGENTHPVGVEFTRSEDRSTLPVFTAQGVRARDGDTGMVTCASCHDAHQWNPNHTPSERSEETAEQETDGDASNSFLRRANDQGSALCRDCHEDRWQLANTDHNMGMSRPDSSNAAGTLAGEAGMCGSCHRTHNGLGPAMWARAIPKDATPAAATCLSCHGAQGPAATRPLGRHSHPVGVAIDRLEIQINAHGWSTEVQGINGPPALTPLPLFDEQGNVMPDGKIIGCGSCHDPHGQVNDTQTGFLRIPNTDGDELCINCHIEKDPIRLSPHGKQKPDTGGVCLSCHRAHAGEAEYMWAMPKGPGQQPVQQLCSSCHQNGGDAENRLTGQYSHPMGVPLNDGNSVDCASCHNPHQWDPNDPLSREGLSDSIDGNNNTSFLRVGNEFGGLCIECHEEYSDVAGTDHDMQITAANIKNHAGQSVSEAGLCGQCHTPHNALSERALWAREPGESMHQGDRMCLGCHSRQGVARNKIPAETDHPAGVLAWSAVMLNKLRPEGIGGMPVFDGETDSGLLGEIGCLTCHDPHQWTSDHSLPPPGKNIEGDVQSSFLRLQSTKNFLCANCHGKDALFRYLYFHSSRQEPVR